MNQRSFKSAAAVAAAVALTACATLDHTDVFVLRDPHVSIDAVALPTGLARDRLRELAIEVDGRRFMGYRVAAVKPSSAVLFFTGNGYGASSALKRVAGLYANDQTDVYVVSYGLASEKQPLVGQVYAMARTLAASAAHTSGVPKERVTAIGHSLGGWVTLHLASQGRIGCAVVVGTGTTTVDTAQRLLPAGVGSVISIKPNADAAALNNPEQAKSVKVPTLVIGSERDTVMPPPVLKEVHANLPAATRKALYISPRASHASYFAEPDVTERIAQFVQNDCPA